MSERADTPDSVVGTVTVEVYDGVARILLSNPGKRNAFTWDMYDQLESIAVGLQQRSEVRAVLIRGAEGGGFAAGTDIHQFVGFASGEDGVQYERRVGRVSEALLSIPVPVVALVKGAAVGAGLLVAACCDVVLAERGSRFGAPIARSLGNCLPGNVVVRLRDRLGVNVVNVMLLTGTLLPAEELAYSGFVHRVVDPGGLDIAADELIQQITTSAPLTLRALKELGRRADGRPGAVEDGDLLHTCYGSDDFREGVSAFLAGRKPNWTGR